MLVWEGGRSMARTRKSVIKSTAYIQTATHVQSRDQKRCLKLHNCISCSQLQFCKVGGCVFWCLPSVKLFLSRMREVCWCISKGDVCWCISMELDGRPIQVHLVVNDVEKYIFPLILGTTGSLYACVLSWNHQQQVGVICHDESKNRIYEDEKSDSGESFLIEWSMKSSAKQGMVKVTEQQSLAAKILSASR